MTNNPVAQAAHHPLIKRCWLHALPKPPLLLVPGALCGAWIWERGFGEHLHTAGYDVYAMQFRNHGRRSPTLHRTPLRDYLQDLHDVVSALPHPPIVVAHSLGGYVTLASLNRLSLPAAALLCPVPPTGIATSLLAFARRSPISLVKLAAAASAPWVTRFGAPPIGIYSNTCPEDVAAAVTAQLRAESLRALTGLLRPLRLEKTVTTPLFFIGAEGDYLIPSQNIVNAAKQLGAPHRIFPGMSHTLQAEENWPEVANSILNWLSDQKLTARQPAMN